MLTSDEGGGRAIDGSVRKACILSGGNMLAKGNNVDRWIKTLMLAPLSKSFKSLFHYFSKYVKSKNDFNAGRKAILSRHSTRA